MKAPGIVLIEDNPADVYLVELALEENGVTCDLRKFRSGEEGLRVLCPPDGAQENEFVPDAILLDLNTPRSDGFSVLVKLKQCPRLAGVPIAVLTSSHAMSDKQRVGLQGSRFIQKPSQLDEFLATVGEAVKEMLEEGRTSKQRTDL